MVPSLTPISVSLMHRQDHPRRCLPLLHPLWLPASLLDSMKTALSAVNP